MDFLESLQDFNLPEFEEYQWIQLRILATMLLCLPIIQILLVWKFLDLF